MAEARAKSLMLKGQDELSNGRGRPRVVGAEQQQTEQQLFLSRLEYCFCQPPAFVIVEAMLPH